MWTNFSKHVRDRSSRNPMVPLFLFSVLFFVESPSAFADEQEQSAQETDEAKHQFVPPKLLQYVEAEYPALEREQGVEAEVVARLDVDESGLVTRVEIVESAGTNFDGAAQQAMEKFVFEPATRDGTPIPARVLYRYTFYLKVDEPSPEEMPPPQASLLGRVLNMDGNPVSGASIILTSLGPLAADEQEKGAMAGVADAGLESEIASPEPQSVDPTGGFAFEGIAPSDYQVDIVAPGYKPFSLVETLVDGEQKEVIYRMELEEVLYETVIRARRPPREVTRREITRREITRIPGTGGDALRSIQNLPGMARAPGISGELIVRGSSPADSLYYFDQMPVPLLYHFGGLTSIINSDLLERIDFFPGNYSVRYGGATGGIVEVYPRTPATDRFHAYIDADFWDIGALVETPLNEDWSIAVSGRRSYIDALFNALLPEGAVTFTVAPRYYDYQLIADYHPDSRDKLQLFIFGSDDKLVFIFGDQVADNPNFSGGVDFSIYFHSAQLKWKHLFAKSFANELRLGSGIQASDSSFGGVFQFDVIAVPVYLRDEFSFDDNGFFAVRTGIDASLIWAKWDITAPELIPGEGDTIDPLSANEALLQTSDSGVNYRAAWYGEVELRPLPKLRFINGIRLEYFQGVKQLAVDPRFVTRYEVVEGTTLKGGIGLFHQLPEEYQFDEIFGNPDINLINAIHYSLGVEQKITTNLEVGLEGFYKDISNLVVGSEKMVERGGELVPERYSNDGVGHVYGMEFLLKHYPTDRFFGWITYTLMNSRRTDHPGEKSRRFDYDQTHILTVVASVVLGRGWEAGLRYRLVSGNPETPVLGSIFDADSDVYFPVYGAVNSARLPMFHQLDIRVDKKWAWKYLKLAVYIDVQNVYNQKNPEGYQYSYDYTERKFFNGLPLLPSLGLKLEY